MLRFAYVSLLIPALTPAFALAQSALTPRQVYDRCRDSVVSIEVETGKETVTGTGFFYGNGRTIATAMHVLDHAKRITIKARGGDSWAPVAVVFDSSADTALLRLGADSGRKPIPHAPSDTVQVGDPVYVIGDPLGLTGTLSTGVVGALRESEGVPLVQITAAISHGSSGGPVLDGQGRAIGIVSFMLTEGQNVNLAISTKIAKTLIASKEALTMSEWEAMYAKIDKASADKTTTDASKDEAKGDTNEKDIPKPSIEAARRGFAACIGRCYSDMGAENVRWTLIWAEDLKRNDAASVERLVAESRRLEAALMVDEKWKEAETFATDAQVPRKDLDALAQSVQVIKQAIQSNIDAQREVKAAALTDDDSRLTKANAAMQAQWSRMEEAIYAFALFGDTKPWRDEVAFEGAVAAPVKMKTLLDRLHAYPDVDLPSVALIRGCGSWESDLKAGDVIVKIALDTAQPSYVEVSDWQSIWNFFNAKWDDGHAKFLVKVRRGGKEIVVHEYGENPKKSEGVHAYFVGVIHEIGEVPAKALKAEVSSGLTEGMVIVGIRTIDQPRTTTVLTWKDVRAFLERYPVDEVLITLCDDQGNTTAKTIKVKRSGL